MHCRWWLMRMQLIRAETEEDALFLIENLFFCLFNMIHASRYWVSSTFARIVLYVFLVLSRATDGQNDSTLSDCLENIKGLRVVLPGDNPQYNAERQVWELKVDEAYPSAIISPTRADQIQQAVLCAKDAKVRVVPKSGGHSYEGFSMQNKTLSVDLSRLQDIAVSKSSGTITCGAGADLGQLYYYAWEKAGKGINAGTCPPVGVSGFMLGGGFGYYSRREGMSCDNVRSLKMVTWEGELLEASAKKNADLFWASCGGGGGNFGVVTEWTINMMDVPKTIQYATIKYDSSIDTAVEVFHYYQTWAAAADANLGTEFHFGPTNPQAKLFFYYAGEGNLQEYLENESKLLDIGGNPSVKYTNYTWINAVLSQAGWGLTDPKQLLNNNWSSFQSYRKERSYYVYEPYSKELIASLFELWQKMYPAQGNIKLRASGGKIADRSPRATAFPHREALGWMVFKAEWDEGDTSAESKGYKWMDASAVTIKKAGQPDYAYINYIDTQIRNWQDAYFRFNYPRLRTIKSKYDPKDMFTFPDQGIQTKKPRKCTFTPCVSSS